MTRAHLRWACDDRLSAPTSYAEVRAAHWNLNAFIRNREWDKELKVVKQVITDNVVTH